MRLDEVNTAQAVKAAAAFGTSMKDAAAAFRKLDQDLKRAQLRFPRVPIVLPVRWYERLPLIGAELRLNRIRKWLRDHPEFHIPDPPSDPHNAQIEQILNPEVKKIVLRKGHGQ